MLQSLKSLRYVAVAAGMLGSGAFAQDQPEELIAEVQGLEEEMGRAMVAGDIEATLGFYADDAVILPNNAPMMFGKDAFAAQLIEEQAMGVTYGSFGVKIERAWECEGRVYAIGACALSVNLPDVPRPVADKGKNFIVFARREDGSLLVLYDMWNTDVAYGE